MARLSSLVEQEFVRTMPDLRITHHQYSHFSVTVREDDGTFHAHLNCA
jgi:hypothetical protein